MDYALALSVNYNSVDLKTLKSAVRRTYSAISSTRTIENSESEAHFFKSSLQTATAPDRRYLCILMVHLIWNCTLIRGIVHMCRKVTVLGLRRTAGISKDILKFLDTRYGNDAVATDHTVCIFSHWREMADWQYLCWKWPQNGKSILLLTPSKLRFFEHFRLNLASLAYFAPATI